MNPLYKTLPIFVVAFLSTALAENATDVMQAEELAEETQTIESRRSFFEPRQQMDVANMSDSFKELEAALIKENND